MTLDLSLVRSAFDALPLAVDPTFNQVVAEGRLRYLGSNGAPDLVDLYSARLVCSDLASGAGDAILVVFPDRIERRAPLLFSTALIMDGLAQIKAGMVGQRVLYFCSTTGIRMELRSVRLGSVTLDGVFAQQYGRGRGDELRVVSLPGGLHLPSVLCICAPADPAALLRQHRPRWVAVDCRDSQELAWLPSLLSEAKRLGVPVVGWVTGAFSETVDQWLAAGGGVFRWPSLRRAAQPRITTLEQLAEGALEAEVTPRILVGEHVVEISRAFAKATEALIAAREFQNGRLAADAVTLGWKYLRAMESAPVPLEVYDREANSYWGMRRITDLRENFAHFTEVVRPLSPRLHATLEEAEDALSCAYEQIGSSESPLWLGLANLCVESTSQRRIVFASKAKREIFSLCLLARFNMSEDDLRDVGVRLGHVSEGEEVDMGNFDGKSRGDTEISPPLFAGMPTRFAEKHLETLLKAGHLEIVLWPHQEPILERRVRHLSSQLGLTSMMLGRLLPTLDQPPERLRAHDRAEPRALKLAASLDAPAGAVAGELRRSAERVSLWNRRDASEVVAALFGSVSPTDDEEGYSPPAVLDDDPTTGESRPSSEDIWVQEAVELHLEGGYRVLLPTDETVNVILRVYGTAQIEPRYVRSLRPGDEILFILGQRRQSLYELLVSRVHRDPGIAQYLALVRRWQDDFVRAFTQTERQGETSPEGLLQQLQAKGSRLTSPHTIRSWLRRLVLAPNDPEDLRRVADVLALGFVSSYYRQIDTAGKRLKALHISLSARLNRWLESSGPGTATIGAAHDVIDADLGLTVEDFRHSLLRARVLDVKQLGGPFYRSHLGRLEGGTS